MHADLTKQAAVQVYASGSSSLRKEETVDTTGAGDAFIASMMYGLLNGKTAEGMLKLGSVVSGCKCTKLGARPGLPRRDELDAALL
jgi:ribokinase